MPDSILTKISELTDYAFVKLTDRGNSAIKASLELAKQLEKTTLIIPDQGGWKTYKQFGKELGFEIVELETDDARITKDDLEAKLKAKPKAVLLFNAMGAYIVPQNFDMIYTLTKQYDCLTIEDVTGTLGMPELKTSDADIKIGSMGKGKIVNLMGQAGFISVNTQDYFTRLQSLNIPSPDKKYFPELDLKLLGVPQRAHFLLEESRRVKAAFLGYVILHQDAKGINVIIRPRTDEEKEAIRSYAEKEGIVTVDCDGSNESYKVKKYAICLEVKRLQQN